MISFLGMTYDLESLVISAVTALAILIFAWLVGRYISRLIRSGVNRRMQQITDLTEVDREKRADTVGGSLSRVARLAIWIIALITVASEFGVNVAPVITGLGIGGLAVAFAAQHIIRDYLHGFLIITEDWYRIGEAAKVAGNAGLVVEVNLRTTVLRDGNGALHQIPNGQISQATNMTREFARINFNIEVGYGENLDQVISVINDECEKFKEDLEWSEQLIATPKAVRVDKLGASGVEIKIMGDTMPMSRVGAMGELRKRLKNRFDVEGIEIPWPQTVVHFGNSMPKGDEVA